MTFSELEKDVCRALEEANIENASAEAVNFIIEVLGFSRSSYALKKISDAAPERDEMLKIEQALPRRCAHEPLQYITGKAYFRDLELEVNSDVLIPRFETELLVDTVLENAQEKRSLLDIGTGSGAIAISCAYEAPHLQVTAVDISPPALRTARRNAEKYRISNISFKESDLFGAVPEKFDIITANLPYVTNEEYSQLQSEVRDYEPRLALTAEQNGLELIYNCCDELDRHLMPQGFAIFEMSPDQTPSVKEYLEKLGFSSYIVEDYTHRPRFVCARKA